MCLAITATKPSQSFFQTPGQEKKEAQGLDFLRQARAFGRAFYQLGWSPGKKTKAFVHFFIYGVSR
jgi:hypothetical protein